MSEAAAEAADAAAEAAARVAEEPDEPAVPTTVPQSFIDCAARFRRTSFSEADPPLPRFDCTWRYYEGLNAISTYEMAMAGNRADAVGDLYIDEVLVPEIAARLAQHSDNVGWAQSWRRLLGAFVGAARNAGEARCAVIGDIWSGGTIRVAFVSACGIENRDRLINDLLEFEQSLLPR